MATKRAEVKSVRRASSSRRAGAAIAPQAMLTWTRLPEQSKREILAAVDSPPKINDHNIKTAKVGGQLFMIRRMPSGFRVVFESSEDRNTIVSVLTPSEARSVSR